MRRNPPAVPADTSPEVWRRQMAAIAARPIASRIAEWEALNTYAVALEVAAVRRRHPQYTDREVFLAIVRRRYGDELFERAWPGEPMVDPELLGEV
jgi:hypothetical protein